MATRRLSMHVSDDESTSSVFGYAAVTDAACIASYRILLQGYIRSMQKCLL